MNFDQTMSRVLRTVGLLFVLMGRFASAGDSVKIISDLDDTIKITGAPYLGRMAQNTYFSPLRLIPGVKNAFEKLAERSGHPISIVSSSPEGLRDRLQDFLGSVVDFSFELVLRSREDDSSTYKFKKISEIILRSPQNLDFILIGDDTSRDFKVYEQIQKAFPGRIRDVYIHRVSLDRVEMSLPEGQHSYVTPVELIVREAAHGRVNEKVVNGVLQEIELAGLEKMFPPYYQCPRIIDSRWMKSVAVTISADLMARVEAHLVQIANFCRKKQF